MSYREYNDFTADPYQLENLLADADPANDPDVTALSARLAGVRQCAGTGGNDPSPVSERYETLVVAASAAFAAFRRSASRAAIWASARPMRPLKSYSASWG